MSGLPNLQKLIEQATDGPWVARIEDDREAWVDTDDGRAFQIVARPDPDGFGVTDGDAALIAAAPAMADLLTTCEQALATADAMLSLIYYRAHIDWSAPGLPDPYDVNKAIGADRAALTRLADFDREIA